MNGTNRRPLLWWAVWACCCGTAAANITVRELPSGRTGTLPAVMRGGELLVALPPLFERLGFKWRWDDPAQQLTCVRNARQYVFTQDIQYYFCDNALFPLPAPVLRIGASLYLPMKAFLAIYKGVNGPKLRWDAASKALTINKSSYSVASVACEKKQNGVLVTVELADSLPFDYTYYYPNVTLNFFGATVDTAQVRSGRRIGFVDSLFGVQFNESAQVSLLVTREI